MSTKENAMQEVELPKPENKTLAASKGSLIRVSEKQFMTVREETLESLNLLNSSGSALLSALQMIPPPPDSGRTLGEYSAHSMRQIAKSICDIVMTKTAVIRQIHSIARDE